MMGDPNIIAKLNGRFLRRLRWVGWLGGRVGGGGVKLKKERK